MLSTREKNRRDGQNKSRRNRNPETTARQSYDRTVVAKTPALNGDVEDPAVPARLQSWDDIVFENRNRDYGAYVVRKGYINNLYIGLIATVFAVGISLAYPTLAKWFGEREVVAQAPPRKLVYTELSAPPPIDKPKPPPPQVQLPKLQRVIKFVPPKVVKEQIAEAVPTLTEIRENQIGAEEVEGPAEVIFDEPVAEVVVAGDDELFTVVDQQPEYAGGYEAMMAFIRQNMKYPANARRMQIEGTVHIGFIVSKTGEISDVKVLRGIMTECDNEAIRVVRMMPHWKPGKQNGRPVNVRFILPLKFRLN